MIQTFLRTCQKKNILHLIPHIRPCRSPSPVLNWTIAMLSLGMGPWKDGATQQEVETWVLSCKSMFQCWCWCYLRVVLSCAFAVVINSFPLLIYSHPVNCYETHSFPVVQLVVTSCFFISVSYCKIGRDSANVDAKSWLFSCRSWQQHGSFKSVCKRRKQSV